MSKPYIIQGGAHSDDRGRLGFVNDFRFPGINRFYTITQSPVNGPRAWQGHREESKYFYCTQGSFLIKLIEIDDWENPSENLEIASFLLTAEKSEVLVVPGGFANGLLAKEDESQLMVFSEMTVEDARGDEYRFDKKCWINWEKI